MEIKKCKLNGEEVTLYIEGDEAIETSSDIEELEKTQELYLQELEKTQELNLEEI